MEDREYLSPDGELGLIVIALDGDLTVGFAGCPSHTHGSILAELFGCSEEEAIIRFVRDIIDGRQIIALWRVSGRLKDVWLPLHEGHSLPDVVNDLNRYGEPDETVEFRFWDGTIVPETRSVGLLREMPPELTEDFRKAALAYIESSDKA